MSLKSDVNPPLKHKDLVFILAIAGRLDAQLKWLTKEISVASTQIDAQSKALAKELDKEAHIYKAYAVLDSLSSSYSMFKYFFDVCLGGTADDMHNFMLTPAAIVGITIESVFLVGFSFLACQFDKEKENNWKKSIADAWPYVRDVMKGLKNAYKGWRSTVIALNLLHVTNANALIMPVGLILGVFAAANRYFMRSITEARKAMMGANSKLFLELQKKPPLTACEVDIHLNEIKAQTDMQRYLGFFSASLGGFVDGLYLYVGVLGLATLAPQLLIVMASLCAFYTLACIVTRIYEEYDFQLRLMITQAQCELEILNKRIQSSFFRLLTLKDRVPTDANRLEINALKKEICILFDQFDAKRQFRQKQVNRSYGSAFLLGMRHGLYAYGAYSSVLFLVSGFLMLGGVPFPPAFIAISVCLGLVLMIGFIIHALVENYQHRKQQGPEVEITPYSELMDMRKQFERDEKEEQEALALFTAKKMTESLKDGTNVKAPPNHYFQEWFEVFRSLFSGLSKGQKFVEFAGNSLQEVGDDGHYHDSPLMFVLSAFSALLFGAVLAFRALARGLGRTPLGTNNESITITEPKQEVIDSVTVGETAEAQASALPEPSITEDKGESIHANKRNDSPKNSDTLLSMFGFFKANSLQRSKSDKSIFKHAQTIPTSTVQGLN